MNAHTCGYYLVLAASQSDLVYRKTQQHPCACAVNLDCQLRFFTFGIIFKIFLDLKPLCSFPPK